MFKFVRFAELPVTDQDRAVRFYTGTLGLTVAQDAPYKEGWRWIELEIPGGQTRILLTENLSEDQTDAPRLVLVAADVKQTYREMADKGVVFTSEPVQAPWNPAETFAVFRDSEGNTIVIGSE